MQVSIGGSALKVSTQVLRDEFGRSEAIRKLVFAHLDQYVNQISQRLICNSHHMMEERFCSWLLMIQDRTQSHRLPLTQEQIARFLGVHRPSVTRIAKNLRDQKIINYLRGKIVIQNRAGLAKAACGCHETIDAGFEM